MKEIRCPYCIEKNGFKVMARRETHLICEKCGHKVVPDRPTFRCSCANCEELNRRSAGVSGSLVSS